MREPQGSIRVRAAAAAAAVIVVFLGVMYVRFASDAVRPPPQPTASPVFGPARIVALSAKDQRLLHACENFTRYPKPERCGEFGAGWPVDLGSARASTPPPIDHSLPDILKGMKVVPLEPGPPFDLPRDLALILEAGCWGCEGGPSGLVRMYVRPDGSVAYEPLIDRLALGIPPQLNTAPDGTVYEFRSPLTGYAIKPDGSKIVASLCARGRCGFGGGGYDWTSDSQTAIFSSSDGGISWTELGRIDVGAEVLGMLPDDRILLVTFPKELTRTFQTFPDLSVVEPPAPSPYWGVEALPNGELLWEDNTGVTRWSDGRPLLSSAQGVEFTLLDSLVRPPQMDVLGLISGNQTQPPYSNYLVPFDGSGAAGLGSFATAGYSVIWSAVLLRLGVDLPKEGPHSWKRLFPTSEIAAGGYPIVMDYDPVVVDLQQGTMRVLEPFTRADVPKSRNHIIAVQRGPFARVINTDNTCLSIRAAADPSAEILDCAAEGVLLRASDQFAEDAIARDAKGVRWQAVTTPSGIEGWASTQYLDR